MEYQCCKCKKHYEITTDALACCNCCDDGEFYDPIEESEEEKNVSSTDYNLYPAN